MNITFPTFAIETIRDYAKKKITRTLVCFIMTHPSKGQPVIRRKSLNVCCSKRVPMNLRRLFHVV